MILVTDDIPYNRDLIKTYLDRYNFRFLEAENGQGMIDQAKENRPDLILLDLNLPRVGGREVLEEVKKSSELRTIPIVVLTSSDAENDIARSYDLGANCYITKPIDLASFISIVNSLSDFWFTIVKLPPKQEDDE